MRSIDPIRALVLLLTLGLAACGASPSRSDAGDGDSLRVTLRDYGAARSFELVSTSHTDRLEYYSQVREDAARKIQQDEVMEALVEELERVGYDDFASPGRAPRKAAGVVRRGLEVEAGGTVRSWLVGKGAPREEQLAFQECMATFLQLYNASASYQTIENKEGSRYFDNERRRIQAGAERR